MGRPSDPSDVGPFVHGGFTPVLAPKCAQFRPNGSSSIPALARRVTAKCSHCPDVFDEAARRCPCARLRSAETAWLPSVRGVSPNRLLSGSAEADSPGCPGRRARGRSPPREMPKPNPTSRTPTRAPAGKGRSRKRRARPVAVLGCIPRSELPRPSPRMPVREVGFPRVPLGSSPS